MSGRMASASVLLKKNVEFTVRTLPNYGSNRINGGLSPYSRHSTKFSGLKVRETWEDGIVKAVQIESIWRPEDFLHSTKIDLYARVTEMEICCPVSTRWVFYWISCLPCLEYVRFGGAFSDESEFEDPPNEILRKINNTPSVKSFIVCFNKAGFDKKRKSAQEQIIKKMDIVLYFAGIYLKGLEIVDITLPEVRPSLNYFLKVVPNIKANGETIDKYGVIRFATKQTTTVDSSFLQTPPTTPEIQDYEVAAKKIRRESLEVQPQNEIELIDLCNDENDLAENMVLAGEPPFRYYRRASPSQQRTG